MRRAVGENGERTETDMEFSHFDADGNAVMVDVSGKKETERKAIDKRMEMHSIHLCTKTGGKSGDFSF